MRTIKFRAWDKENNKFFEPTYEAYKGKLEELILLQGGDICMRTINEFIHQSCFPDRFITEQFTGLIDKNSKEIYEGDIIKDEDELFMDGKVHFDSGAFGVFLCYDFEFILLKDIIYLEVIGNIHQNPELCATHLETNASLNKPLENRS